MTVIDRTDGNGSHGEQSIVQTVIDRSIAQTLIDCSNTNGSIADQ